MGSGRQIFSYVLRRELNFLTNVRRKFLLFCLFFCAICFVTVVGVFHNPVIRKVPIAVVDNDGTEVSRHLIRIFDASPDIDVRTRPPDPARALEQLKSAEVYGIAIIPENFTKTVLGYKGAQVPFYYNNQLYLPAGIANRGVVAAVREFSSIYNKSYEESEGTPVYAASVRADPIAFNSRVLFNPYFNYQYFMVLGILPSILQLVAVASFVYAFGFEFKTGGAKDLVSAVNSAPFLTAAAKGLPYWIIFLANAAVMLLVQFGWLGTPWHGSKLTVMAATFLFVTASTSIGLLMLLIGMGSLRMALSAMAVYAAPAFAYAGVTFPSYGMPPAAVLWSEFLPLTHYHRILINDAIRGAPISGTPYDMLYLFLFSVISFVLGAASYRFIANRPGWWGRL